MSTVQSIERAFNILDVIASSPDGISVTEASKRVGLPTSTVSRLILTLEHLGAVERLANEQVKIGQRIFNLGTALSEEEKLINLAMPHLEHLAEVIGEDAALVVPDKVDARFAAQASGGQVIQVQEWTGSKFPMHTLTAGKFFLANFDKDALEHYLKQPLEAFTKRTLTDPNDLKESLKHILKTGLVWSFGEFEDDINAVSTPIYKSNQLVACLTVYAPSFRFPKDKALVERQMQSSARKLSARLSQ